jgi:hypothetical protein
MSLKESLRKRSVTGLTRLAAMLALVGLAIMACSVVVPRPVPVVFAMSVGHAIGIAAFACYLLAVLLDISRSSPATSIRPTEQAAESADAENAQDPRDLESEPQNQRERGSRRR